MEIKSENCKSHNNESKKSRHFGDGNLMLLGAFSIFSYKQNIEDQMLKTSKKGINVKVGLGKGTLDS